MNPADLPGRMAKHVRLEGECWLWTGAIQSSGYGVVHLPGIGQRLVHRAAWEALVEPIPDGLTIDHLCRVKPCINPAHLEVVTLAENGRRANEGRNPDVCPHGHAFKGHNLMLRKGRHGSQHRVCRACRSNYRRFGTREVAAIPQLITN